MPQRDLLFPWRRALPNATVGAEVRGLDRRQARAAAAALFERFGLAGFERAWPSQLSGGMRQRLALLRTFVAGLDVLALDEPFGALDAITRSDLQRWLAEVLAADRRTTVLVTHDIEEALVLSDRVVVLSPRPGTVVATLEVPFERPRTTGLLTSAAFVALKADILKALGSP
jgi:ABC-type nitrate/sulfonate/bicarbonate transport system ATPase subunit